MRSFFAAFFLLFHLCALAENPVEVRISNRASILAGIWIDLSIENMSEKSVCLNARAIGLDGPIGDQVIFPVKGKRRFRFTGVNLVRDEKDSAPGVMLEPHQRIVIAMDLSKDYEFVRTNEQDLRYEFISVGYCHGKGEMVDLVSKPARIRVK